jgi:predicted secreted protein
MQVLPVTVAVTGTGATPTGSVQLSSGGYTSPASKLVNGQTVINIPANGLAVGAAVLTAAYTPDTASTAAYTAANGTANVTVTAVTVQLPSKLQGYKAQIAYNPGTGIVILAGLKNVKGGFKADELDSTDHGNNGWKSRMSGLLDFDGSADLDYIEGDASQQYLLNAVLNHIPLLLTLFPTTASGSTANSFVGPAVITDWEWSGDNTKLQDVSIKLAGNGPFSVVAQ